MSRAQLSVMPLNHCFYSLRLWIEAKLNRKTNTWTNISVICVDPKSDIIHGRVLGIRLKVLKFDFYEGLRSQVVVWGEQAGELIVCVSVCWTGLWKRERRDSSALKANPWNPSTLHCLPRTPKPKALKSEWALTVQLMPIYDKERYVIHPDVHSSPFLQRHRAQQGNRLPGGSRLRIRGNPRGEFKL